MCGGEKPWHDIKPVQSIMYDDVSIDNKDKLGKVMASASASFKVNKQQQGNTPPTPDDQPPPELGAKLTRLVSASRHTEPRHHDPEHADDVCTCSEDEHGWQRTQTLDNGSRANCKGWR